MTIMELGALGEFFASVGVIVSLLFVGYQVRQSRIQMRANTTQTRTDSFVNLMAIRLNSPELIDALLKRLNRW